MININLEDHDIHAIAERDLLEFEPTKIQQFYALTGAARQDYASQMAEAEAHRIRVVRQAQADGLLAIRKAEAEGFRIIGETLEKLPNRELIMKLAGLMALQEVAKSLADGKATKLFLPHNVTDIFSLIGGWKETLGTMDIPQT